MEISSSHHQLMATHPLEEVLNCPKAQQQQQPQQERKPRPHPDQALRCPRCDSTNTKFCYYNNYSLSQPRYFCKGCRRYWTQGGSLRNVPVGGGCRKNKRPSSSSSSSTTTTTTTTTSAHSSKRTPQDTQGLPTTTNPTPLLPTLVPPPLTYDPSDLTLAFASLHKSPAACTSRQLGLDVSEAFLLGNHTDSTNTNPTPTSGFLDILRGGLLDNGTPNFSGFPYHYSTGFGSNGAVMEMEGGHGISGEEMMMPFDQGAGHGDHCGEEAQAAAAPASGQVSCKALDGGESKMLMGLQWQLSGDANSLAVEPGRSDYWNGVGFGVGSSWHGLINSSLM